MVEKSIRLTVHGSGDVSQGAHASHRFSHMDLGSREGRGVVFSHRVLPNDVDQFKHMSFANYIKLMFDASDTLFLRMLGDGFQDKFRTRLKYATLQFKKQTRTGDLVFIIPSVQRIDDRFIIRLRNNFSVISNRDRNLRTIQKVHTQVLLIGLPVFVNLV